MSMFKAITMENDESVESNTSDAVGKMASRGKTDSKAKWIEVILIN